MPFIAKKILKNNEKMLVTSIYFLFHYVRKKKKKTFLFQDGVVKGLGIEKSLENAYKRF